MVKLASSKIANLCFAGAFGLSAIAQFTDKPQPTDLIMALTIKDKINNYRGRCGAQSLTWNDDLARIAQSKANDCTPQFDYLQDIGESIFQIGREDGEQPIDLVNASKFAIDHWWELRQYFKPKEEDWDDLLPFTGCWEFTQMVWKANMKVGCAWSESPCKAPQNRYTIPVWTLVCEFYPGGNDFNYFKGNVSCPDCPYIPVRPEINTETLILASPKTVSSSA